MTVSFSQSDVALLSALRVSGGVLIVTLLRDRHHSLVVRRSVYARVVRLTLGLIPLTKPDDNAMRAAIWGSGTSVDANQFVGCRRQVTIPALLKSKASAARKGIIKSSSSSRKSGQVIMLNNTTEPYKLGPSHHIKQPDFP